MAEKFLEDFYQYSIILETLHEVIGDVNRGFLMSASTMWNSCVDLINALAKEYYETDVEVSNIILSKAEKAVLKWKDSKDFSAYISSELIPLLFTLLKNYTGISVVEGRYSLESADSALLTIKDTITNTFLHDPHDPMYEARVQAESLWSPTMDEFHLYGLGLGYLAYQLWVLSGGSMKIIVFEPDMDLIKYASHYGVLDWIDASDIDVRNCSMEDMEIEYWRDVEKRNNSVGRYATKWINLRFQEKGYWKLSYRIMSDDAFREYKNNWIINCRKNMELKSLEFSEVRKSRDYKEWIVVAAGPSLDDNIDFLLENQGERGIIVVDIALKKVLQKGIIPDIVVAVDYDDYLCNYLAGIDILPEEMCLIASAIASWRFVHLWKNRVILMMPQNAINICDICGGKIKEVWNIGGTVSSLAIEAAIRMEAQKVWLIGLDLARPHGKAYANGMESGKDDSSALEETLSVNGDMVATTRTFLFFKQQIEQQIGIYDTIEFINMSHCGAMIRGTKSI